jgi:predicted CXXCH cytochrome family protein
MKKLALSFVLLGALVLVGGIAVATAAPPPLTDPPVVYNMPPADAKYVGSESCFSCHSSQYRPWTTTLHAKMIQDVALTPTAIIADFTVGAEVREFTFDGTARAYGVEDVVFTMGNKYRQRYITKTAEGKYVMLPGQWNVDDQKWVAAAGGADWLNDCAGCHTTGFDVAALSYTELSVGCESCHGPGSVHIEKAKALTADVAPISDTVYDVRKSIVKTVDSAVCGQCHTRGKSPDGVHGYPVGYVVGGPLDETMFIPVAPTGADDDPNFWPDGTEKKHRQQYITLLKSGHGSKTLAQIQDLAYGADRCMGCHSTDFALQDRTFAQDVVTKETAVFNITCVQCHSSHGEAHIEDQLVGESYALCVSCHTGTNLGQRIVLAGDTVHHAMREMFEGISFLRLPTTPSAHFTNEARGPVCASCHMPRTAISAESGDIATHTFHIVLPSEAAEGQVDSCSTCHSLARNPENTPENLTFSVTSVQKETRERVEQLRADLKEVRDANPNWDPKATDKSAEQLAAERVHTLLSFVEADGSWGFHNPRYTKLILDEAEKLIEPLLP